MALKEYEVEIAGVKHTLQLDEKDAKAYGDNAKEVKRPANKAAEPQANKAN